MSLKEEKVLVFVVVVFYIDRDRSNQMSVPFHKVSEE